MKEWIPAAKRLPPHGKEVLLWIAGWRYCRGLMLLDNYAAVGFRQRGKRKYVTFEGTELIGVTHWKPIIAPNLKRETK